MEEKNLNCVRLGSCQEDAKNPMLTFRYYDDRIFSIYRDGNYSYKEKVSVDINEESLIAMKEWLSNYADKSFEVAVIETKRNMIDNGELLGETKDRMINNMSCPVKFFLEDLFFQKYTNYISDLYEDCAERYKNLVKEKFSSEEIQNDLALYAKIYFCLETFGRIAEEKKLGGSYRENYVFECQTWDCNYCSFRFRVIIRQGEGETLKKRLSEVAVLPKVKDLACDDICKYILPRFYRQLSFSRNNNIILKAPAYYFNIGEYRCWKLQ